MVCLSVRATLQVAGLGATCAPCPRCRSGNRLASFSSPALSDPSQVEAGSGQCSFELDPVVGREVVPGAGRHVDVEEVGHRDQGIVVGVEVGVPGLALGRCGARQGHVVIQPLAPLSQERAQALDSVEAVVGELLVVHDRKRRVPRRSSVVGRLQDPATSDQGQEVGVAPGGDDLDPGLA